MHILFSLTLISIVGLAGIFIWFLFYNVIWGMLKGAPYVPSNKDKIKTMLELADIAPGEICYDLGSGNGILLFEAAKCGAIARGAEINPFLVQYTRLKAKKLGLAGVSVVRKDFRKLSLCDADVVFLYLWPSTNASLREKLTRELKPGARIVANAFHIAGMVPEYTKNDVYRYRVM